LGVAEGTALRVAAPSLSGSVAAGDAGIAARVVTTTTLKNLAIRMTWFTVSFLSTIRYPFSSFADSEPSYGPSKYRSDAGKENDSARMKGGHGFARTWPKHDVSYPEVAAVHNVPQTRYV
jgi:hypothetical protein